MAGEGKGFLGSLAVHAGIICAIVGFSWFASRQTGPSVEAHDPFLTVELGTPGKRPGQIDKAPGVAKGHEAGSKTSVPLVHIKKLDFEKIEREREKAEKAEQAAANSAAAKTTSKANPKAGASAAPGKTSLNDFLSANKGGKAGSGKAGSIGGVAVRQGRDFGTGDNGGEGGSTSEMQAYLGEVLARFRSAWREIVEADGGLIAAPGSCGVTLAIDAAGGVSFAGWVTRPKDAHMAELVQRACAQIGNCGKPPSGKSLKIDFAKVKLSDG